MLHGGLMPRAGVGHTQGYLANSVINYFHLEINQKSGSSIFFLHSYFRFRLIPDWKPKLLFNLEYQLKSAAESM